MPEIPVKPFKMTKALLRIVHESVSNDYQKHVSGVVMTPSASTSTWKGLDPEAIATFVSVATWVATFNFAQDWETPDSLSQFLLEHEGEEIDVVFEPVRGGMGFAATLIVTPGAIGGEIDAAATASVTLGMNGRPVPVPAGSAQG